MSKSSQAADLATEQPPAEEREATYVEIAVRLDLRAKRLSSVLRNDPADLDAVATAIGVRMTHAITSLLSDLARDDILLEGTVRIADREVSLG